MRAAALLASACLIFAAHAQAQSPPNPPSTNDFVNKVADSDMFEIQSSEIALQKHPDRDTRPFAAKMVKDHTKTSKQLKSLVSSGTVKAQVPTTIDGNHQKNWMSFEVSMASNLTRPMIKRSEKDMRRRWSYSAPMRKMATTKISGDGPQRHCHTWSIISPWLKS